MTAAAVDDGLQIDLAYAFDRADEDGQYHRLEKALSEGGRSGTTLTRVLLYVRYRFNNKPIVSV